MGEKKDGGAEIKRITDGANAKLLEEQKISLFASGIADTTTM